MMKIPISLTAKQALDTYISLCKGEVSGLGTIAFAPKDGALLIDEIALLTQTSSASETELSQDAILEYMETKDNPALIRVWWHSHGAGRVFWSSQDEKTVAKLNHEWILSIVGNRAGEYLVRFDQAFPIKLSVDAELEVIYPVTVDLKALAEEVKAKVREPKPMKCTYYNPWDKALLDRYEKELAETEEDDTLFPGSIAVDEEVPSW